jgi:serine/threonine protein phosphatase PrpC
VLTRLDAAMQLLDVDTTATVVVVRLEQTPEERERGVTRMRWSSAGHPPPMTVDPDGTTHVVGWDDGMEPDLLLGFDPRTPRVEREVVLGRGATVLLYTDGLVERRGQSIDEGLDRLRETVSGLAGRDLEELCETVLARLLPGNAEDDVAIAAVRLHPQGRRHAPRRSARARRVGDVRPPERAPDRPG